MAGETLEQILTRHLYRMAASGMFPADADEIATWELKDWFVWCEAWTALAEQWLEPASGLGSSARSAAERQLMAGVLLHWAQFNLYEDRAAKAAVIERQASLTRSALLACPQLGEPLTVPSAHGDVPCYLALPGNGGRSPVVLIVPGLDSTKEEMFAWRQPYLDRGIGVLAFDGPGQGELSGIGLTRQRHVDVVSAVLDALSQRADVDATRLAVLGVSLGGLLATIGLAADERLAAGVEISAAFDTAPRVARINDAGKRGYRHIIHAVTDDDVHAVAVDLTVEGLQLRPGQRLLALHGTDDRVIPAEHLDRYQRELANVTAAVLSGGGQGCFNLHPRVHSLAADWLAGPGGPGT
jgi:2,6-dihydroxypseudooxynicotine hydrolase